MSAVACSAQKTSPGAGVAPTGENDPISFVRGYLEAFGGANLQTLEMMYEDEVTVIAGSTLLDPRVGGLGGDDGRSKNKTVPRGEYIKALKRAIDHFGGSERWATRSKRFQEFEIQLMDPKDPKTKKALDSVKANETDIVVLINPRGDSMAVVLREDQNGQWRILAEFWD